MNLLFIGDIVGRPGRNAVRTCLPRLVQKHQVDFVVANGENGAGGLGITQAVAEELYDAGVDVVTTGNHIWRQRQVIDYLEGQPRLLRPSNYPPGTPGRGSEVFVTAHSGSIGVVNVQGRVFMEALDCPFRAADAEIERLRGKTNVIVVDIHAEATSEKVAMGWYLDGRASAVVGTHTHVQTSDERVTLKGTAYISDVGMTGARDSVLGMKVETVLQHFLTGLPVRFEVAGGPTILSGALISIDTETGAATHIERVVELDLAGP